MEAHIKILEKEKDHLIKIIEAVKRQQTHIRCPYTKKYLSICENLKVIARNLDKLSEQVQSNNGKSK